MGRKSYLPTGVLWLHRLADFSYDFCENLNVLVDVVSSYIPFCTDTVISSKEIIIFPINKLWLKQELKSVLNNNKLCYMLVLYKI